MSSTEAQITMYTKKQSTMSKKQQEEQTAESDTQKLQILSYHIQIIKRRHLLYLKKFLKWKNVWKEQSFKIMKAVSKKSNRISRN